MLNVEEELRQGKIYPQEVNLFEPEHTDIEVIPFVKLSLTDKLKVKFKAESAAKFVHSESNDKYLSDLELRNKLIYWAVIFGVSIDDEPAYKRLDQGRVENYIENGPIPFDCYENLGLEILAFSGLDDLLPNLDQLEEDEPEVELEQDGVVTTSID